MRTGALGGTGLASPTDALLSEQRLSGASGALANLARQFRGQSKYPAEWSPYYLFANGEAGAWYDPSDFSTLFQDSAGTTPVTALGQPVGRVLDKSGRGNHLIQSTAASRPTVEARVNLLTRTEEFDNNSVWSKEASSVTSNAAEAPNGTVTADALTDNGTNSRHIVYWTSSDAFNVNRTFSVYAKQNTLRYLAMSVPTSSDINCHSAIFDLQDGVVSSTKVNGTGTVSASIEAVGNGWYRCAISGVIATSSSGSFFPMIGTSDRGTFTGSLTNNNLPAYSGSGQSLYIWGAQIEVGSTATTYQRVTTSTDYADVGAPRYLQFDGVDDSLVTAATLNLSSTNSVSVFAGFRKLSAAINTYQTVASHDVDVSVSDYSFGLHATWDQTQTAATMRSTAYKSTADISASTGAPFSSFVSVAYGFASTPQTVSVRSNGASYATGTIAGTSGNVSNRTFRLGQRAGQFAFNGRIHALIIRGATSDATTITNAEQWVAQRTGVTLP